VVWRIESSKVEDLTRPLPLEFLSLCNEPEDNAKEDAKEGESESSEEIVRNVGCYHLRESKNLDSTDSPC